MFTRRLWSLLNAAVLVLFAALSTAGYADERDLDVRVQLAGDEIRATASLVVRASQQRVWDVLTDFERAPEFTRDLQVSRILSRSGDTLRVLQRNQVRVGPFAVPVETVREVRLVPQAKIDSRLVSGSLKRYDSVTEIVPEGSGTRIVFRSFAVPSPALAGFVSEAAVKRETEERFRQLRAEILRREHVASAKQ